MSLICGGTSADFPDAKGNSESWRIECDLDASNPSLFYTHDIFLGMLKDTIKTSTSAASVSKCESPIGAELPAGGGPRRSDLGYVSFQANKSHRISLCCT